jgi:hypothetical protein
MKEVSLYIIAVVVLVTIGYGSWRFEKWVNYKFSYESEVKRAVEPLEKRITELEKRVMK